MINSLFTIHESIFIKEALVISKPLLMLVLGSKDKVMLYSIDPFKL